MKKFLFGSVAAAALFTAPALAADMTPAPAPVYSKAPMMPVFSWTGFYIGGNIGGHYGQDSTTASADPVGWLAVGAATINAATPGSVNPSGFEGGGQIGYNVQYGSGVFGVEADAQWLGGNATRSVTGFGAGVAPLDVFTTTTQSKWLATFRGRVGVAFDRTLWYITGGGAYSGVNFTDSFGSFSNTSIATVSNNSGIWGWVLGGGLEWAFTNNWSVKGEYLYAYFGSVSTSIPSCAICATGSDIAVTHKYTESLARLGLNFKLGGM
jgi:outer membrane immunogenic protein